MLLAGPNPNTDCQNPIVRYELSIFAGHNPNTGSPNPRTDCLPIIIFEATSQSDRSTMKMPTKPATLALASLSLLLLLLLPRVIESFSPRASTTTTTRTPPAAGGNATVADRRDGRSRERRRGPYDDRDDDRLGEDVVVVSGGNLFCSRQVSQVTESKSSSIPYNPQ